MPQDAAFDHRNLATPELDRWKAAEQGHAAIPRTATNLTAELEELIKNIDIYHWRRTIYIPDRFSV